MEVPLAVLADGANVSQEGKLNIFGVFNQLNLASFPVKYPHMTLVFQLQASPAEGGRSHQVVIHCMDEDGLKLFEATANLSVQMEDPAKSATINHLINLQMMEFQKDGDYSFNILVNNELKRSIPLAVKLTS